MLCFQSIMIQLRTRDEIYVFFIFLSQNDKVRVVQTLIFVTGLSTLLQTLFGTRLPAVMGGSYAFLIPAFTIINSSSLQSIQDDREVNIPYPKEQINVIHSKITLDFGKFPKLSFI